MDMKDVTQKTQLLGHRGSPRAAKENTIESFRLALQAGLDGLELDLHRTRDGVLAIYHDFELEQVSISRLDWAELKGRAPWMPRLEEVFELAEEFPEALLNLEIKSQPPDSDGREAALALALKAWPGRERAWVSSFDPLAIIRLRKHGYRGNMALLYAEEVVLELLPCTGATGVHPHYSLLSQEKVAAFREQGLFVYTWTVNSRETARQLQAWGVNGLIGDLPSELLALRLT
jgi:glycerophosphoryl diester phosphodiesterase